MGSKLSFRDDISLVSLGDSFEFTPDAKGQKLVSPFNGYLNDTISFENDADDLNVSFSDLYAFPRIHRWNLSTVQFNSITLYSPCIIVHVHWCFYNKVGENLK